MRCVTATVKAWGALLARVLIATVLPSGPASIHVAFEAWHWRGLRAPRVLDLAAPPRTRASCDRCRSSCMRRFSGRAACSSRQPSTPTWTAAIPPPALDPEGLGAVNYASTQQSRLYFQRNPYGWQLITVKNNCAALIQARPSAVTTRPATASSVRTACWRRPTVCSPRPASRRGHRIPR